MDDLHSAASWEVWRFVQGETAPKDFDAWVCSNPGQEGVFGHTLYADLIVADYRNVHIVVALRERLFDWALASSPSACPFWDYVRQRGLRFDELPMIDLGLGSSRRLLCIGYWRSDDMPHLPHPRDYVDREWDAAERGRVIEYLDHTYVMQGSMGFSWCRMGCPGIPSDIGTKDLTDGTWVFPEGFGHYVRHHAVKPDTAFLEHVRRNGYRVPDLPLGRTDPRSPRTRNLLVEE